MNATSTVINKCKKFGIDAQSFRDEWIPASLARRSVSSASISESVTGGPNRCPSTACISGATDPGDGSSSESYKSTDVSLLSLAFSSLKLSE